jgi:hypothetical protein
LNVDTKQNIAVSNFGKTKNASFIIRDQFEKRNIESPFSVRSSSSRMIYNNAKKKQSTVAVVAEKGLEKLKEDYLMGLEDMVPDLSSQIVSDHHKLKEALTDIERLRKEL